jgi:hypothetical protein
LERDPECFVHTVTEEDTLANPELVAEILKGLGGKVEKQVELINAITKETECSERSAKKFIKNAVGDTIKEFTTGNKTKGYRLMADW